MAGSSTSADSGNTRRNVASGHSVFLSHSGAQKDFVEQLCVDLESCNRSVFFDKRSDSLPKGEPFPQHIFRAIGQCQVGVVVLSEEFFSSRWPMIELVEMSKIVKLSNSRLKIMPIFLSISPGECRDETKRRRWLSMWSEWAEEDRRIEVEEWKAALKLLGPTNGFIYKVGLGEVKFRKEIVREICKVVLARTTWDDCHVQGGSRLCKVIREKLDSVQGCDGVRVVGVYGVGGIGKTTLCKSLCKDFLMEFQGKVCHVELKEGGSKVDLLRQVLRRLTNTSEKVLQGFNEDECCGHLRQSMIKQRVFIAIDNVSDSSKCLEEANIYRQLNYVHGSVVIVTGRSLDQLRMLKIDERNCLEMPDLEKGEVRSLFLYHATHGGHVQYFPKVEVDEEIIKRCLRKCYFGKGPENKYHYHPLALEVLGRQLGYSSKSWNVQLDELDAGDTFNQFRERESEHPVFSILRRSFDMLTHEDQLLFMDAALFNPESVPDSWREISKTDILKWLSLVHGVSVNVVKQRLTGLKRKSVIEDVGDGTWKVGMHDLWREFAVMESKIGDRERQRWVYDVVDNPTLRSEEAGVVGARFGGGWVNLQRICIMRTERSWRDMEEYRRRSVDDRDGINRSNCMKDIGILKSCMLLCPMRTGQPIRSTPGTDRMIFVDEVDFRSCTNVTVLKLVRVMLKVLDLSALQNLRSLEFTYGSSFPYLYPKRLPFPRVDVRGLGGLSNLVVLLLDHIPPRSSWLEQVSGLSRLQILWLGCDSLEDLWAEELQLGRENRYPDLRRLLLLEQLSITRFYNKAKTISGFSERMSHLMFLDLSECSFSRCDGVGELIALEELKLSRCGKLKELPNLQRLTKLRKMDIRWCMLLRALRGFGALVALEELTATGCLELAQLPDLSKLIHLKVLNLCYCPMSALVGLGNAISLREIDVSIEGLEECHDLQMLTELRRVRVTGWGSQGLACLSTLPKLEDLCIGEREEVEVLTGLSNLTSLLKLTVRSCDFQDVSCVGHLSTLRKLLIMKCKKLERLPDIHKLTRLELLEISGCDSLRIWEGLRGSGLLKKSGSYEGSSMFPMLIEMSKCNGVPITELRDVTSFPHLKQLWLDPPTNC